MATATASSKSSLEITPISHSADKKCNFGAVVKGDLNNVSDDDIVKLREALWKHKLLSVKNTMSLEPLNNWRLLERLDPEAPSITQEEFGQLFHPTGEGIIAKLKLATIPNAGHIHLMGRGYQGDDHYGIKGLNLGEAFGGDYYSKELKEEDFEKGHARFQSWHIDGPCYKSEPPMFSSFRTLKLPDGVQEVHWDDGSGLTMKVKPGRTAFFSTAQLYEALSEEEKEIADHSWVEYMHYPYEWIRNARGAPNGLGVANEGREVPFAQMEEIENKDPSWTKKYPLVWVNPLTKEKHFQVQSNTARRLYIRKNKTEEPRIIDDISEVRNFITRLQSRILKPEYIISMPEEEGDLILWYNWGLMHSKVDYPIKFGTRTAHQGWLPSKNAPTGPSPIPVTT